MLRYAYAYAEIEDDTHMCVGVVDTTDPNLAGPTGIGSTYIIIPTYDENYVLKYYIDGVWYVDAEGTIEYIPS